MNKKEALKTRTVQFVFSDDTVDTYGTVLSVDGWDLDFFNKAGVAFFNHNSWSNDPDLTIGTGRAWVEDGKLVGEITFESAELNPMAEKVFQKVLAGTYKSVSVGFSPMERGKWGKSEKDKDIYYYGKRRLNEISIVPVPANSNALIRSEGAEVEAEEMKNNVVFGEIRAFDSLQNDNEDVDVKEVDEEPIDCSMADLTARAAIAIARCYIV